MEINPGDYILTYDKELFVIVNVDINPHGTFYDIKGTKPTEIVGGLRYDQYGNNTVAYLGQYVPKYIKAIPRNKLRHLGKIIPQNKITKTIKLLYG